jgi:hypothetical protein
LPNKPEVLELNAHDITRVWNLSIAIYDGDDEDADLRNSFAQALQIYQEFMTDLTEGGLTFSDADGNDFVSEREVTNSGDIIRFRVREGAD